MKAYAQLFGTHEFYLGTEEEFDSDVEESLSGSKIEESTVCAGDQDKDLQPPLPQSPGSAVNNTGGSDGEESDGTSRSGIPNRSVEMFEEWCEVTAESIPWECIIDTGDVTADNIEKLRDLYKEL